MTLATFRVNYLVQGIHDRNFAKRYAPKAVT